jgi:predicted RNA-binding protein associated with RNAse of E/G family
MPTGIELVNPDIKYLTKKTKKELIEFIYSQYEFYHVVSNGILLKEDEIKKVEFKLREKDEQIMKMCEYNTQAQVMIESLMERWNDYSV